MAANRIVLAALALLLMTVAPEAQGGGGTLITSCAQVVTANAVLTQDLICPGTDGIVVGASSITIDLKGFTLRGNRTLDKDGIDIDGFDRVTVKNGVVRNFSFGVFARNNADYVTVAGLLSTGNVGAGIHIGGYGAVVSSSTALGNASPGISVTGVAATIKGSTAAGNLDRGITVTGDSASISKSTASGNGVLGILVAGNGALLSGDRAEGNGFAAGASDLAGLGIVVNPYSVPPVGKKNIVRGNDDPAECSPALLC